MSTLMFSPPFPISYWLDKLPTPVRQTALLDISTSINHVDGERYRRMTSSRTPSSHYSSLTQACKGLDENLPPNPDHRYTWETIGRELETAGSLPKSVTDYFWERLKAHADNLFDQMMADDYPDIRDSLFDFESCRWVPRGEISSLPTYQFSTNSLFSSEYQLNRRRNATLT